MTRREFITITGQARASQQKAATYVRVGSIVLIKSPMRGLRLCISADSSL